MSFAPPSPPYLGPAKFHGDADNKPIRRIVIHCTVSPCVAGQARNTAEFFRNSVNTPASAHYVVDPAETVQVVLDSVVAFHAPPNDHSIGIELCDALVSPAWDQAHAARWRDDNHARMLRRAARLTARLCLAYDVPAVRLDPAQVRAGHEGLCGHVDVSRAFGQSTHWDPGAAFPWDAFVEKVQRRMAKLADR